MRTTRHACPKPPRRSTRGLADALVAVLSLFAGGASLAAEISGFVPDGESIPTGSIPLVSTSFDCEVSAFVVKTRVEQIYENRLDRTLDVTYVFPLPADAAVEVYEFELEERVVRGELQPREQARRTFRTAALAGKRAALLEQQRPNVFRQSLANLMPGDRIVVRLTAVHRATYESGGFSFALPTVVGPRYHPGGEDASALEPVAATTDLSTAPPFPEEPAANGVAPAAVVPGIERAPDPVTEALADFAPVSFRVKLDAGVPVGAVESPSHALESTRREKNRIDLRAGGRDSRTVEDFVLRWTVAQDEPTPALLAHRDGVDGYFALLLQGPAEIPLEDASPREILFLLDSSGSMNGMPWEASRAFTRAALDTLRPGDRFNIVTFAGIASRYRERSVPADAASVSDAKAWLDGRRSGGGTEMLNGLREAAAVPQEPGAIRMVFLITDGFIGNEDRIFEAVSSLGSMRFFALGMGTSVNRHLIDGVGRRGRGGAFYLREDEPVEPAIERWQSWMLRPHLTDLEIDWGALPVLDVLDGGVRDLFSGQTWSVVGRYAGEGSGEVTLRGYLSGRPWERRLRVEFPDREERHGSLRSVWGRTRLKQILREHSGSVPPEVEAEATALALEFDILSRFTSFVAVDHEMVADRRDVGFADVPVPLPRYKSFDRRITDRARPDTYLTRAAPGPAPSSTATPPSGASGAIDHAGSRVTGGVRIVVRDEKAPLPGATVTLSNDQGKIKTTTQLTNRDGQVRFPVLMAGGGYHVDVAYPGMTPQRRSFSVKIRGTGTLEVVLFAGFKEFVQVSTPTDGIEVRNTASTTQFTEEFVDDLPAPGRFFQNVLTLAPGVEDPDGDGGPVVHGSRARDSGAIVGGVANVDPLTGTRVANVNPDSIEEMEVVVTETVAVTARAPVIDRNQTASSTTFSTESMASRPRPNDRRAARVREASAAARKAAGHGTVFPPPRKDAPRPAPDPARIERWALTVLADLAEDGVLSGADGVPALAALIAAQAKDGGFSPELRLHLLATWAVEEAARLLPGEERVREAHRLAVEFWSVTPRHAPDGDLAFRPATAVDFEWDLWWNMRRHSRVDDRTESITFFRPRDPILRAVFDSQSVPSREEGVPQTPVARLLRALDRGHLRARG